LYQDRQRSLKDFLNRLLSLRRDVAWRRFTVQRMRFFDTFRFLDDE